MKIGILTLPFNNNYGGLLQSYALQKFLINRGHEVVVISNHLKDNEATDLIVRFKKTLKTITGKQRRDEKRMKIKSQNMTQFVVDQMNCTEPIQIDHDFELLKAYNFDAYVVGSDQVWRFDYTGKNYAHYFLNFVDDHKAIKISFSASFGIDKWIKNESETRIISTLLNKFQAISVRENSGIKLCEDHLGITPKHLLDPIFLLDLEEYKKLITKHLHEKPTSHGKGLLVYMLDIDEDKKKAINVISETIKEEVFHVGLLQEYKGMVKKNSTYPPVSDWIAGFVTAKYILTDSFHGCAFAILFNKPFIVYGNPSRGMTRFNSLLDSFHLTSRLITHSNDLNKELITQMHCSIDTKEVINKYKNEVEHFLKAVSI